MSYRHVADIVHDQDPVTLPPTATVLEASARMRDRKVGAVLVTTVNRHLAGIFTGRDACCRVLADGLDPAATTLDSVMTTDPVTLAPGASVIDALRLMQRGGFRHIPVVDGGMVAGVVSRGDLKGIEIDRLEEETSLWEKI
ncbi:MAG: CBS domain-containing protein [Bauldia litoralis]